MVLCTRKSMFYQKFQGIFQRIFGWQKYFGKSQRERVQRCYDYGEGMFTLLSTLCISLPLFNNSGTIEFFNVSPQYESVFDCIKLIVCIFMLVGFLVNLIIIWIFNPKMKTASATCVGGVCTLVLAADSVVDKAIGGTKEPDRNIVIRGIQYNTYRSKLQRKTIFSS